MKIVKIGNVDVQCSPAGTRYSCYIVGQDMYFSCKMADGDEMIVKKGNAMIKAKENFLKEFPQYK